MTTQPKFHWQFNERKGNVAQDSLKNLTAKLHQTCSWEGHGRIGQAIQLGATNSRIVFDNVIGKFGTNDFTVAFGIKILKINDQNQLDLIGNRNIDGHGNWFALFLQNQGKVLAFAVDEDKKGKNFTEAKTKPLSSLPNQKWHHIAIVRQGKKLKIYLDGARVATKTSKTGIAKLNGSAAVKLGHYNEHTPIAQYEDLRVYHSALKEEEIRSLIPPYNPPLQEGEIELVGTDDASIILTQDVDDLSSYSANFQKLRVGKNTGVTLYPKNNFKGISQKCYADLPDIKLSRINNFPGSIRIWSSVGEPFTGNWIIKVPNGEYLSRRNATLTTTTNRSSHEFFRFHYNLQHGKLQLLTGTPQDSASLKVSNGAPRTHLFVEELEHLKDEFFITNYRNDQWLELSETGQFQWTDQKENRALFIRVTKVAEDESQVGELAMGEVALYEHRAYYGKTWILSDSEKDLSGVYPRFKEFEGLNNLITSIRLGPSTGVTLFKHSDFTVLKDREQEIEDIIANSPRLSNNQIGNDTLSALRIFRTISPEDVFTSYSSKLSQDYRMVGDKLEEFSSYRTMLRFEAEVGEIEVSATDLTKIEVEGTIYEIDERKSVTLKPNELNLIMITSEADGLNTPGLKIRTQEMAANEQVVIFPNKELQKQISKLEDDSLWNATDVNGDLIVDHEAHSKEEVASVQNTIKRVMGTVTDSDEDTISIASSTSKNLTSSSRTLSRHSVSDNKVNGSKVLVSTRSVSGSTINNPWKLQLKQENQNNPQLLKANSQVQRRTVKNITAPSKQIIQEVELSQDEFTRLLSKAIPEHNSSVNSPVGDLGPARFIRIGNPFKTVGNALKKATSVVIGAVEDVVNVIVDTAEGIFKFVIDTAEKVIDFVEAVVTKVVKGIKQFIEFLQFLFNWGDILDTQRYLKRTINTSLDSAKQLAVDAKPHVKSFVDDLQDGVEDGMNHLVKTLGGQPSEVEESGFELPEELEWFLSKFIGGSKSSDSETTPDSGSDDSPLASFVRQMLEAFEDAVGAGLRLSEGVFDSIQTLIANPRQPEVALIVIIEALRDAIIQSLDAVENVALSLLDVAGLVIDLFKGFLNAEIRIPFISDLLDFIGIGKLTVLNLATMVLAIPVTITAKLVTGEHLFANSVPMPLDNDADSTSTDEPDSLRDLRKELAFTIIVTWANTVNHQISGILDLFDVPVLEAGVDNPKPNRFEKGLGSLGAEFVTPIQGLEITSFILSYMSWVFSSPAESLSEEFRDRNKEGHREIILWGYRGGLLVIDLASMMKNDFQRMRRIEKASNVMWALFSGLDMILVSLYLAAVEEENDRIKRANISNEVFSWLPNVACFLRSIEGEPTTKALLYLGHVGCNVAAMYTTLTTGGILIQEANKALKEAE